MSFPFDHHHHSHHHHHHHNRRDDEQEEEFRNYPPPSSNFYPPPSSNYPPPPGGPYAPPPSNYPPPPFDGPHPSQPPLFGGSYSPPSDYPPPEVTYHNSHNNPYDSYDYTPPPPQPSVVTIPEHHHGGGSHHFHLPEMGHHSGPGRYAPELGELSSKPTYAIYSKAGGDRFAVAIRDSKLILTCADVNDPTQHWIKDEKYSIKVKDKDGYPSFSLVNKGTKHALKHSVFAHPVQLTEYKPEFFDVSVLWTESHDLGDGYRTIRTVNNTKLVMDAFHGDKDHGGVHDGTIVALYECWKGDNQNQQWKLEK